MRGSFNNRNLSSINSTDLITPCQQREGKTNHLSFGQENFKIRTLNN